MSLNTSKEIKDNNILDSFDEKCKELDIWYSLGGMDLLSLKSENNVEKSENVIEIMMLVEHYNKLVNAFPLNIIDTLTMSNYFYLCPFYFDKKSSKIIKINLLARASIKKAENFYSIKNIIRQKIGYYKSIEKPKNNKDLSKKLFYKFLGIMMSPLTWQEVSSSIFIEKQNGFFVIDDFRPNINQNWIPSITFKRSDVEYLGQKTKILKEWELFLTKKYGKEWKTTPIITNKNMNFDFIYDFIP